jgi:hypothetical protein
MSDPAPRQHQTHREPLGTDVGLHVCRNCRSELMQLVAYEDAGEHHWTVELRCPECESTVSGRVPDWRCEQLDEELERGTHALLDALQTVQQEILEAEVEAFAAALAADLLLPEDF